jgi:hypothetical protein
MALELTSEQAAVLLEFLEEDYRELEIEILRTDSIEYRDRLRGEAEVIENVIGQLRKMVGAARP